MKNQTFGLELEVNRISRQTAARAIAGVLSTDGYTAEVRHEGGSYDAWSRPPAMLASETHFQRRPSRSMTTQAS